MKTPTVQDRAEELEELARIVFWAGSAAPVPAKHRLQVKAEVRPYLREAIHWLRKSWYALLAGDLIMQEWLRDQASMRLSLAFNLLCIPTVTHRRERDADIAARSRSGGKAKAEDHFDAREKELLAEFDRLVRGFITRKERYRVQAWLRAYPFLKKTAMYERIRKIEKEG